MILPVAYVLWSLLPTANAWWSVIDDHRKVYILQVEHGMPVSAAFRHFWHAIDFEPLGRAMRVQPMFHLIWGLELHFFGLNPHAWYLARILYAVIFAGAFALALARMIGPIPGGLLAFAMLSPGYYSQLFARLGVAEAYVSVGAAIALLCVIAEPNWQSLKGRIIALLYALALVVAFGSKEVSLIFIPAVAIQVAVDWFRAGWKHPRVWGGIAGLCFAGFVLVMLILGLRGHATDFNGQNLSLIARFGQLWRSVSAHDPTAIAFLIALGALGTNRAANRFGQCRSNDRTLTVLAVAMVLLGIAYAGTLVFYDLSIPPDSHYAFPYRVLQQAILFTGVASTLVLLSGFRHLARMRKIAFCASGALVLWLTLRTEHSFWQIRLNSEAIARQTGDFEAKFAELTRQARADPDRTIEFVSHSVIDFEPVHSLLRFLRGAGITNPVILNVQHLAAITASTSWEKHLQGLMTGIQPSPDGFAAVTSESPSEKTIKVFFSQPDLSDGAVANFWPM